MNLAALFSGGKDSVFAVYDMIRKGHNVKYLITMLTENKESYMFHYPNTEYTKLQAESMGIPQIIRNNRIREERHRRHNSRRDSKQLPAGKNNKDQRFHRTEDHRSYLEF